MLLECCVFSVFWLVKNLKNENFDRIFDKNGNFRKKQHNLDGNGNLGKMEVLEKIKIIGKNENQYFVKNRNFRKKIWKKNK